MLGPSMMWALALGQEPFLLLLSVLGSIRAGFVMEVVLGILAVILSRA